MKPRILVMVGAFLPGYKSGGPIRSTSNFVRQFSREFDIFVITSDRDSGDLVPYLKIVPNTSNPILGAKVYYIDRRKMSIRRLAALVQSIDPNLIYLNSFFSPTFTILPLLARRLGMISTETRVLLATRGEFAPAALALKSLKKKAYLALFRLLDLGADIHWQVSSQGEKEQLLYNMRLSEDKVYISFNLTDSSSIAATGKCSSVNAARLSFVGRVVPMKNLDFLITVLPHLRSPYHLNVYGPLEDPAYYAKCKALAASLGVSEHVTWHGNIEHGEVAKVLARSDFMVCPSRGENFGHVVYEGLAAGTPVIVSNTTPWLDLETAGVGWVRALEGTADFADAINTALRMSAADYLAMSKRALAYARKVNADSDTVQSHRKAIQSALDC